MACEWSTACNLFDPPLQVEVDYCWMRGTHDGGSYTKVQRLVLGKMRGMRKSVRLGWVALEFISQVGSAHML